MPIVGVDLLWRVEVELLDWPSWATFARRRLRQTLEADAEVVRVHNVTPLLQRVILRSLPPSVTVEVVADSPAAAQRRAERVVARALTAIGHPARAIASIISTEGEPPASAP